MAGPFKLDNQYANYEGHWLANTAYATGKRVIAESANVGNARKYVFEATTGGTSQDPGPPTWDVTPGNTTSDGTATWTCREATTWANAHGKLEWLAEQVAIAGETIHVDQYHKEATGDVIISFAGTEGNPVKVICVDKATDNAIANYNYTNQYFESTWKLNILGEVYFWGCCISFVEGSGFINDENDSVIFENSLVKSADSSETRVYGQHGALVLINSDLTFTNTGGHLYMRTKKSFIWRGGSLSGDQVKLFYLANDASCYIEMTGVDLSSMVGGEIIDRHGGDDRCSCKIKGVILNATPSILIASAEPQSEFIMDIADNGNTVYKFRREYQYGYAQDETTKVITGKALYDGANEFAVKMVSRATPTPTFYDPWRYHLTTLRETGFAANRTYTVHIAQDHASIQPDALDNDEIWIEVVYPDDSTAKFNIANDKIATPTTTPAAQTTSTESWEGLAATTRLQELAVTIASADGKNGPVEIWVCLAKESKTIYVCPEVYVS